MYFDRNTLSRDELIEQDIFTLKDPSERHLSDMERIRILKKAVMDSIISIEETKKAFKSRKLEALRMELIKTLVEVS
jgi:hypothetical protein